MSINFDKISTPCYVLDEAKLISNLEKFKYIREKADVQILVALKAFSFFSEFPLLRKYLDGAEASSLNEARLAYEEMKVKAHVYSPAYLPEEFDELISYASYISFNSLNQWERYKHKIQKNIFSGLRINPEYSEIQTGIYNPAAEGSRFGICRESIGDILPEGITGLHFHLLCENNSFTLERVLGAVKDKFDILLKQAKWLNLGGGHLITHSDYDIEHLIKILRSFKKEYPNLELFLEPGQSVGLNTGYLVTSVLDIVDNHGIQTAIFDASFTCHMPDVLEYPYRPNIVGANRLGKGKYKYRLGGVTCLAGDIVEEYGFDKPLKVGDKLIFEDQIHYTMVKNNHFNGVKLPSIAIWTKQDEFVLRKEFSYETFKNRL